MLLRKRVERAFALLREKRAQRGPDEEDMPLEKGDRAAMIIAGLITLLPIALLVLGLMVVVPMLLVLL